MHAHVLQVGTRKRFPPPVKVYLLERKLNPTKVWKTGFLPRAKKVDRLPPGLTKKELDQRKGSGRERNFPGLKPFYRLLRVSYETFKSLLRDS